MRKITNNILFLPFEKKIWVEKIQEYNSGYTRKNMSEVMEKAGFDMKTLVRKIEDIYNRI